MDSGFIVILCWYTILKIDDINIIIKISSITHVLKCCIGGYVLLEYHFVYHFKVFYAFGNQ